MKKTIIMIAAAAIFTMMTHGFGFSAQQRQCERMTVRELTDTADQRIKSIDKVLKAQEDEKTACELIKKGDTLCSEGNYTEAKKSYQEARRLTRDLLVKREANGKTREANRAEARPKRLQKSCNTKN
jgi:hypothetical protein